MDQKLERFIGKTSADSRVHSQTVVPNYTKHYLDFVKRSKRPNSGKLRKLAKRRSVLDDSLDNWMRDANASVESSLEKRPLSGHEGHRTKLAGFYHRKDDTVKVQRIRCLDCPNQPRYSADPISVHSKLFPWASRYSDELIVRVINAIIDGRESFRSLYENPLDTKIGLVTAYRWVIAAARGCKSPLEVSMELKPVWGGSLQLDAFHLKVQGLPRVFLLAVDAETQDILHARVLPDEKDHRRITKMLIELRDVLHYHPKIIVIDDNPSLLKAVRLVYPNVPVQLCAWHKQQGIGRILPFTQITKEQSELKELIRQFLYAETISDSNAAYQFIIDNAGRWPDRESQDAIISIKRDRDLLTTHLYVDEKLGLMGKQRTPRVTSKTEGIISRLRDKIKQVRGYKSIENLPGNLNLLVMHHRAAKLRSGKDRRSPLARAQRPVDNWLIFSQQHKSTNETISSSNKS